MLLCKVVCSTFFIILVLLWAPDLQAPEIATRDIFGFDPYMVVADGAIVDSKGVVKGWIREDTVYDARWNARYRMDGSRLCRVVED